MSLSDIHVNTLYYLLSDNTCCKLQLSQHTQLSLSLTHTHTHCVILLLVQYLHCIVSGHIKSFSETDNAKNRFSDPDIPVDNNPINS